MRTTQVSYEPIPDWCARTGMSRAVAYRHISAGNIKIVKLGKRTLVDVQAGLAWMKSLPSGGGRGVSQSNSASQARRS